MSGEQYDGPQLRVAGLGIAPIVDFLVLVVCAAAQWSLLVFFFFFVVVFLPLLFVVGFNS